jgi:cytochrome c-type biogenesis protein CcmH
VSVGLALAFLAMISLALALLLAPLLWRRRGPAARDAYNLAVYKDQLAEVERDLGRGLLTAEQAEAARTEIGRRILALDPAQVDIAAVSNAPAVALLAVLLLPLAALVLYWQLGSPTLPDEPFAERHAAPSDAVAGASAHVDINQAIAKLEAHLKAEPQDLTGWLLLGRSDIEVGHYQEAAAAYQHADDLSGHRADIAGDRGEALVLAARGTVTPAAREAFAAGLKDPENAPRSRYYLALAQMQQGDVTGALKSWRALAADAPKDAAWLPLVQRQIAAATAKLAGAPGANKEGSAKEDTATQNTGKAADRTAQPGMPSGAAVAAAEQSVAGATPAERQAMIDTMVARLAARLEQHPDDVEGWSRLGRSYMVLGQPEKAREAYAHALKLRPDDAALKEALAAAGSAAAQKAAVPAADPAKAR